MDKKTMLLGVDETYGADVGGVYKKNTQHIQQSFLDKIKEQRNNSKNKLEGEFMSSNHSHNHSREVDEGRFQHHVWRTQRS